VQDSLGFRVYGSEFRQRAPVTRRDFLLSARRRRKRRRRRRRRRRRKVYSKLTQ
jgi:hypothetical protein